MQTTERTEGAVSPSPGGSDFRAGAQGKVVHGLKEIFYFLFQLLSSTLCGHDPVLDNKT